MAKVRTVKVNGRRYLQVAEPQANGSISVLQSFGEFKLENWLRAQQFANSYNQLRDLAKTRQPENSDEFFRAALAIFGVVLGAAIIAALLGED